MILKMYAEAKGTGFDAKVMRKIVSIRRQDKSKRQEEEEILTSSHSPGYGVERNYLDQALFLDFVLATFD